ncbi:MAG TPA: SRPBCC family protein [Ktedonobacterales bacterium]
MLTTLTTSPDPYAEGSMITFDLDTTINRPLDVVFAYVADPAKTAQWTPAIIEQRLTSPEPVRVGSTGINVRQVMGQRIETTWEVTAYTANAGFALKSTSGPVSYEVSYTFEAADGATRLRLRFTGEPKGFFKVAEPLLANSIKNDFREDFARLKALLEGQT